MPQVCRRREARRRKSLTREPTAEVTLVLSSKVKAHPDVPCHPSRPDAGWQHHRPHDTSRSEQPTHRTGRGAARRDHRGQAPNGLSAPAGRVRATGSAGTILSGATARQATCAAARRTAAPVDGSARSTSMGLERRFRENESSRARPASQLASRLAVTPDRIISSSTRA